MSVVKLQPLKAKVILKLITKADLDYQSIRLLKQWRIKNRFAYVGNYKITHKSMKKWLVEYVILKLDRFLWWVIVDGERIGHIGVKSLKRNSIEIDNISRGVDKYKGVMHKALGMILDSYKGYKIWLRVLPNNIHAGNFYKRNGFEYTSKMGKFVRMEYEN